MGYSCAGVLTSGAVDIYYTVDTDHIQPWHDATNNLSILEGFLFFVWLVKSQK